LSRHVVTGATGAKQESTMTNLIIRLATLAQDRRGVTAMEYGLIAALIAVVIIGALTTTGANLTTMFNTISAKLI
jgi:pilus assembly protein Flp/PilA